MRTSSLMAHPRELTNLNPCEEPNDPHVTNLSRRGSCRPDDDRNSEKKGERRNIDEVTRDDTEVDDFGVDSAHASDSAIEIILRRGGSAIGAFPPTTNASMSLFGLQGIDGRR
jgi:hypothetical protein